MMGLRKLRTTHYSDEIERVRFFDALPCYPKQARWIAQDRARFSLFLGGVGTGKSTALIRKALLCSLKMPGELGLVCARTTRDNKQTLLPLFFEALELYREATGVQLLRNFSRSEMRASMENGSQILWRGYTYVDALRGISCAWAGIDEIEYCRGDPKYSWDVISGRVREGDPKRRQLFAATTPNGLQGITAYFVDKQRAASPRHYVAHATVFDNPYLEDGYPCEDCGGTGCERCGGTGQASEFRDALRASSSKRYWLQDGKGQVLKSQSATLAEYSEERHVVPWTFDRSLPFGVGIDWGEASAAAVLFQFVDTYTHDHPAGTWIVCDELHLSQCSRQQFRRALLQWLKSYGDPYWAAADRAVPSENRWLRSALKKTAHVKVCESRKMQRVRYGVEAMRSMLDPTEGPPRLLFADSLNASIQKTEPGIRSAMVNMRYKTNPLGELTDQIAHDDIYSHFTDALRYAVITSALHPPMHGGRVLPFMQLDAATDSRADRYREVWEPS